MFKKVIVMEDKVLEVLAEHDSPESTRTVKVLRTRKATDQERKQSAEGYGWLVKF